MKIDRSLCEVRRDMNLPCERCECSSYCGEKEREWMKKAKNVVEKAKKLPQKDDLPPKKVVKKRKRVSFTESDIAIMRDTGISSMMAAKMTGHHVNSIYRWRKANGVVLPFVPYDARFRSNSWREKELEVVKDTSLTTKQVAELTGRTYDAIRKRRHILGIKVKEKP